MIMYNDYVSEKWQELVLVYFSLYIIFANMGYELHIYFDLLKYLLNYEYQ